MTSRVASRGLILVLTCLAQFMVVLDVAIVNVALPAIQRDLDMKQSALQWVVIAYSLILGGFLLLGGRLGDLLGRRRVFLAGATIFSAASLLAGLAQSADMLIGARALQGFGAALLAPTALSILAVTFREGADRNKALGIFGAVGGSSASVGVIVSGLLTDGPGWRWIFFINVPVGVALVALAAALLPRDEVRTEDRHYDTLGAATVTGSLLLFVYTLDWAVDHGWGAASTLAMFVGSAALMAAFVAIESRTAKPLVPLPSLKNRTMVAADIAALLLSGAFFAFVFLGSLMMQQLLDYSPTQTGVAWLATSVTAFIGAAIVGAKLATAVGIKRLLIAGMLLLGLAGAWLTRLPQGASYPVDLLPALLLAGMAIGLSAPSVQIGALAGVSGPSVGLASGLVETMREIGGAVGVAVVSTVLLTRAGEGATIEATFEAFRAGFGVIVIIAAIGVLVAMFAFPRVGKIAVADPHGVSVGAEAVAVAD